MSVGTAAPPATVAPSPVKSPASRRRRWPRLVVPYAVVVALLVITAIAYVIEEPDPTDRNFLAPGSTADIGARDLAQRLEQRGVRIERHTRTPDALESADRGDAVLLIPAPDLLHTFYLRMLKLIPQSTTVVLVRPSNATLRRGRLPAWVSENRWATTAAGPGCGYGPATAAGRAGVRRTEYRGRPGQVSDRCYHGSLLRTRHFETTLTLVGATDPFRNDRIAESGNAVLAVELLSTAPRVIWLDLHAEEPGPPVSDRDDLDQSPAPAELGRGSPDPDFPVPDPHGTDRGEPEPGAPNEGSEGGSAGPSTFDLFPAAAWTVLALVMAAALLAAAARARRIGSPVPEPLPVLVPATETVTGRGRLYQRARDRGATLAVLQHTARDRIAHAFDLPPDADRSVLVPTVAEQTGIPADEVDTLLYASTPESDEELVTAAAALETLVAAVTRIPEGEPRD